MSDIKTILAQSRLLEYSSNLKHGINRDKISFSDEIGKIANSINQKLKNSKGIDIFNPNISFEEILKFEHFISNSISNYANNKIIKRNINDEIEILKESISLDTNQLDNYNLSIAKHLEEKLKTFNHLSSNELIEAVKTPLFLSLLPGEGPTNQFFISNMISLKQKKFVLICDLVNSKQPDELVINSYFLFPAKEFEKYLPNPTQLFLKGLDKYGVDLNILNEVSRYYYKVSIPLPPNDTGLNFLNIQNVGKNDDIMFGMLMKQTNTEIKMANVYGVNFTVMNNALNLNN